MAMQTKLWSVNALAVELGIDRRTVARRLDGVPPDGRRRGHPVWRLETALAHLRPAAADPDGLNPQRERARLDRARADAQEQRNWLALGQMVTVEDVARVVTEHYGEVRSRLMELPGRLAQELALECDPAGVERRLKDEVAAALSALNARDTVA